MWPRNLLREFKATMVAANIALVERTRVNEQNQAEPYITSEVRFHHLRHTAATRLREAGADELLIGAFLGHSKKSVTQEYIHLHIGEMRRVVEAVEQIIYKKAA